MGMLSVRGINGETDETALSFTSSIDRPLRRQRGKLRHCHARTECGPSSLFGLGCFEVAQKGGPWTSFGGV